MKINARRFTPSFCCPCVPPTHESYPHALINAQNQILDLYEAGEDPSIYQIARIAKRSKVPLRFCLGVISSFSDANSHTVNVTESDSD